MTSPLRPAAAAAALLLLVLTGCATDPTRGYSMAPTYSADIRTVSVPMFKNDTFSRGVEFELTDAIVKEIQRTTPWRIVGSGAADAALTGAITESRLRMLTTDRVTGYTQEMAVILKVDFDFRDLRSGQSLAARRGFTAAESFVPAGGVRERLEVGEHATVQELAQAIVAELRSNW